jgi:hypothetical protein
MAGCEGRRPTAAAAMETSLRIQISAVIQREETRARAGSSAATITIKTLETLLRSVATVSDRHKLIVDRHEGN